MTAYTSSFYRGQMSGSMRSARVVVPHVLEVIQPESVVDVGCGVGTWARVWMELATPDVLGVDGDYVDPSLLVIPPDHFRAVHLQEEWDLGRRFSLATCLEVAEHLDPEAAPGLVRGLCDAADAVLFSAAAPGQGGTDHRNEQWPSYWVELFDREGYGVSDEVRSAVWDLQAVEWFYRQNILLFRRGCDASMGGPLDIRHPEAPPPYVHRTLRTIVAELPRAFNEAARHRVKRRIARRESSAEANVDGIS